MPTRLISSGLAVLAVALTCAGSAAASNTRITVNASVKPSKAGTPSKPVGETVSFMVDVTSLIAAPPAVTDEVDIYVPKELRDRGAQFPSCSADVLGTKGVTACPAGSKVGDGSATGRTLGVIEPLQVQAYNGPGGQSLILFVTGTQPATLNVPVIGAMKAPAGVPNPSDFSTELAFPVPQALTMPLPGADGVLTHIAVRIDGQRKVHGRTVHYFESVGAISALAVAIQ